MAVTAVLIEATGRLSRAVTVSPSLTVGAENERLSDWVAESSTVMPADPATTPTALAVMVTGWLPSMRLSCTGVIGKSAWR